MAFPWMALGGGVLSMFGGGEPEYQMSPAEAWRLKIARQMFREARGRVPGAAPDERMALADANAMIGEQGGQMMEGLFASSAGGYGDTSGSDEDALTRMSQMMLSTKAQMTASMMQGFIRNKKADMQNAVGLAGGGGGTWSQPEDIGGALGALAMQMGYQKGQNRGGNSNPNANTPDPTQAGGLGQDPITQQNTGMGGGGPMAFAGPQGMNAGPMPSMTQGAENPYGKAFGWWAKQRRPV